MAWTSPTTVNTTAGINEFLPYLSEVSNFWFGRMLMVTVFMIFLFGYLRAKDDFIGGLAIASYITFVMGLLFWTIGLVTGLDFAIIIGVTVGSSVLLFTRNDK